MRTRVKPALEHFAAKNTAASRCSGAPRLAIGHSCSSGVKLAVWVGLQVCAGLSVWKSCMSCGRMVWEVFLAFQAVLILLLLSAVPLLPTRGKEQAGEKLGMVAPPACQ